MNYLGDNRNEALRFNNMTFGAYVEFDSGRSVDSYMQYMIGDGPRRRFGGPIEILCFHRMTGLYIDVYIREGGMCRNSVRTPDAVYRDAPGSTRPIRLLYNGVNHYDILRFGGGP